jgi:hypothetical protein
MSVPDILLQEAIASLKHVKNDVAAFTEVLKIIDFCLGEDAILARSLETIDAGNVVTVVGEPSGRSLHQIYSSGAKKAIAMGHEVDPGLSSGLFYTVISGRCSCYDFARRVESNLLNRSVKDGGVDDNSARPRRYCKHSLAASIADALGRSKVVHISDLELFPLFLS